MKQPKDMEEVGELVVEVDLEEGGIEEEDQADVTILMNKDIWPETFLTRDDHSTHTIELMFTQLKISQI
jgi:hypothetical protein